MRRLLLGLLAGTLLAGCGADVDRVVVAAGTTIVDSGVIDHVAQTFQTAHPGVQVSVVGEPTALALELGRDGTASVSITHAPLQERAYIESGDVEAYAPVLVSRFVLIGPGHLAEDFSGRELPEVMRDIWEAGIPFVSRGDSSGTHDKELENWAESGLRPEGQPWYLETGLGMGETILVADQRQAVTLAEYGAYLAARDAISIVDLGVDPAGLENPYTAMVWRSADGGAGAMLFLEWLTSAEGAAAVEMANRELLGDVVYAPAGGG